MKVFISADIEGTTLTTYWDQTEINVPKNYANTLPNAMQMTAEVKAACEGAIAAGATEIVVKDSHDCAVNMDITQFPECVQTVRNWSGSYMGMVTGVDESFDAVLFVGYHAAAGRPGNPLSHTHTSRTTRIRLNGLVCSEFLLYSWACAQLGVPTVFLAGDKMLTEDSQGLHPMLKTVAVKDGFGGSIRSLHPKVACDRIRATVTEALSQDLSKALCKVPDHFELEISYKEHRDAVRRSFYPGMTFVGNNTIRMETDSLKDILTAVQFVF